VIALALAAAVSQIEIPPSNCTLAQAERITLEMAIEEGERLNRRCVALRGIWSGRALYRDLAHARLERSEIAEGNAPYRIGLSAPDAIARRAAPSAHYLMVGILYDCSVFDGEEVYGYCHFHLRGPLLAVTHAYRDRWPTPRWER
jgi:hypothetical protein